MEVCDICEAIFTPINTQYFKTNSDIFYPKYLLILVPN